MICATAHEINQASNRDIGKRSISPFLPKRRIYDLCRFFGVFRFYAGSNASKSSRDSHLGKFDMTFRRYE